MRARSSVLLAALLAVGSLIGGILSAAPAAAAACGTAGNFQAGRKDQSPTWGAAAEIIARPVGLYCSDQPNTTNTASQWVALQGVHFGTGGLGIIQVGVAASAYYTTPCIFTEAIDGAGADTGLIQYCTQHPININNNLYTYGVAYDSVCHCENMALGFTVLDTTNFDPVYDWSGLYDNWSSETDYYDTTIPETTAAPTNYLSLASQAPNSSSYTSPPPGTIFAACSHAHTTISALFGNGFLVYHPASGTTFPCP